MRILIVDDNISNLDLLKARLDRLGHDVVCAKNGDEAVEIATTIDYLDMIIMDLRMPGMDGYEATQKIKSHEHSKSIPVIALSANSSKDEVEKAMDNGCDEYLTKPIMKEKLIKLIQDIETKYHNALESG